MASPDPEESSTMSTDPRRPEPALCQALDFQVEGGAVLLLVVRT